MIKEVQERQVLCGYCGAVIRNGKVTSITKIEPDSPSKAGIKRYIAFLEEVLQAIKGTE